MREQRRGGEKDPEDRVRDHDRRNKRGQRLPDEELLATDRGDQDRLERALLALADDRVGGDDRRHDHRDHEHVEEREPNASAEGCLPVALAAISWIIGRVMNSTGVAAIVPITKRLRR